MICKTWRLLAVFAVVGCSKATAIPPSTSMPASALPERAPIETRATPQPDPILGPTPTAPAPDVQAASPTAVPEQTLAPAWTPPADWKTFASASLGISLDYPADWSVAEQATGAIFTAPHGATIVLAQMDTGELSVEDFLSQNALPNMHCSSSVNTHGVTARVCFDTLAFTYTADLLLNSLGSSSQLISLSTNGRSERPVFDAMIASVRPAP
jgi:hypothetical protein